MGPFSPPNYNRPNNLLLQGSIMAAKLKHKFITTLAFLRLVDENAQLSLTNMCVMLVMFKLFKAPTVDMGSLAALLGVISSYQFKRYTQRKKDEKN